MTDGIIKGTGNSRFLKAPANAMTLYPSYESFIEAMVAGTFPIDLNGINPAGWQTVGNKLDKATLLTDSLCTALGLATTATPTQAMDKLRTLVNTAQNEASVKANFNSGSYSGNGGTTRTILFQFPPKLLIVFRELEYHTPSNGIKYVIGEYGVFMSDSSVGVYSQITDSVYPNYGIKVTVSLNSMTLNGDPWGSILNTTGKTYYYVAIG